VTDFAKIERVPWPETETVSPLLAIEISGQGLGTGRLQMDPAPTRNWKLAEERPAANPRGVTIERRPRRPKTSAFHNVLKVIFVL